MPKGTRAPTSALTQEISRVLSQRMVELGTTKMAVARATGISRTMVIDILSGKKHVTLDDLDKLCNYLCLDLEFLVRNAEIATAERELPQPFLEDFVRDSQKIHGIIR